MAKQKSRNKNTPIKGLHHKIQKQWIQRDHGQRNMHGQTDCIWCLGWEQYFIDWWQKWAMQGRRYLPFSYLTNQEVVIKQSVDKRCQKVFSGPRMIATLTGHDIQEELKKDYSFC